MVERRLEQAAEDARSRSPAKIPLTARGWPVIFELIGTKVCFSWGIREEIMSAPNSKAIFSGKAAKRLGIGVLAAGLAFMPAAFAYAQDAASQAQIKRIDEASQDPIVKVEDASTQKSRPGKPVTLRIGPGFNPLAAQDIAGVLRDEGCPTEILDDLLIPNTAQVYVDDKRGYFTSSGSAGSFALRNCKSDLTP